MNLSEIDYLEVMMYQYMKIAHALRDKPDFLLYSKEEEQWNRENPNCNKTRLERLGVEIRIKMKEVEK